MCPNFITAFKNYHNMSNPYNCIVTAMFEILYIFVLIWMEQLVFKYSNSIQGTLGILNPLSAKSFLRCFILFYDNSRSCGICSGHNKSCAASGCSRSIAGSLGLLDILWWPSRSAKYLLLAQSLKTLKLISSWRVNIPVTKCCKKSLAVSSHNKYLAAQKS